MAHKKMAEYAYENIPFYQKLREQPVTDWEQYPVIDKKMIVDKKNMLFAPEYIGDLYGYVFRNIKFILADYFIIKCYSHIILFCLS